MSTRDYQRQWITDIRTAWTQGANTVFATLPTGSGKTHSFVTLAREDDEDTAFLAHRQELIGQAALTLNRDRLPHHIEAPREVVRQIIQAEMRLHGESFYSPGAKFHVAGVNTLARRKDRLRWCSRVRLVIGDEGHHYTEGGIFHEAFSAFPDARGLLVSAHCLRGDGAALGRGHGGIADALVIGPSERELISRGFLSDYRVALPPNDLDVSSVRVGSGGDFSAPQLRAAVHASKQLVGNVAAHYERHAAGKLGLTFAVDIEHAGEIRAAYAALGIAAEIVTGETPIDERADLMQRFRERRILQLVSVDVLGEGTDVPDVEVVSMARPTASFQLFSQQKGRMGRVSVSPEYATRWETYTDAERLAIIAAGPKPFGWLFDHAGNFARHYAQRGMPCAAQRYSLLPMERRSRAKSDAIPLRTCLNETCFQPYPRTLIVCPHCGTAAPAPAGRAAPEQVDGDLVLLDPETLAALAAEVARIDGPPPIVTGSKPATARGILRNHSNRQTAQAQLRERMAVWMGWRKHLGADIRHAQREFFHRFGVDVLTAQTWGVAEACALAERVHLDLYSNSVHSTIPPPMTGCVDLTDTAA